MKSTLSTRFTGIEFENPFLLASAPPTESDSNIMRAFEAGWGGVVVKTIGMHPVVNVKGPKTKFLRSSPDSYRMSMEKRPNTALASSMPTGSSFPVRLCLRSFTNVSVIAVTSVIDPFSQSAVSMQ